MSTRFGCPVQGCRRAHRASMVMCMEHWNKVPAWLRTQIWGLFTKERGSPRHRASIAEAVALVNRAESKEQRAESKKLTTNA